MSTPIVAEWPGTTTTTQRKHTQHVNSRHEHVSKGVSMKERLLTLHERLEVDAVQQQRREAKSVCCDAMRCDMTMLLLHIVLTLACLLEAWCCAGCDAATCVSADARVFESKRSAARIGRRKAKASAEMRKYELIHTS